MPVWNDEMVGHQAANEQASVSSASIWRLLLCNAYRLSPSDVWVIPHHSLHAFDMRTIKIFVYFVLQFNKTHLAQTTFAIPVVCWEVTWPADFQTRCCQYTGIPLGWLHWNHTGWCYHPVVFQWKSSSNLRNCNRLEDHWSHKYTRKPLEPVLICIIGAHWKIHWKTTWGTLETHWQPTFPSPVVFQCTFGSKFRARWITTELPLALGTHLHHISHNIIWYTYGMHTNDNIGQWPCCMRITTSIEYLHKTDICNYLSCFF